MIGTEFEAYIPLSDTEKKVLWDRAVFVFDTNVFLRLYKYGHVTRKQIIALLTASLSGRVWIPYHVTVEFFRNRIGQLSAEKSRIETTITGIAAAHKQFMASIEQANLTEIGITDLPSRLTPVSKAIDDLCQNLGKAKDAAPDLGVTDDVLTFFRSWVGSAYGPAPANQAEVDAIAAEGGERYRRGIPPGYKDDKEKQDQAFVHAGLQYENRYGDLIIWRQLLDRISKEPSKMSHVILVTGERKDDWWWRSKGETLGPRVEMRQEIVKAGAKLFHMYHFAEFFERLPTYLPNSTPLEASAIKEIKSDEQREAATSEQWESDANEQQAESEKAQSGGETASTAVAGFLGFLSQVAVERWLKRRYPTATIVENKGFPDLLLYQAGATPGTPAEIGVEVITPRNPMQFARLLETHLGRAARWLAPGRQFRFVVTLHRAALANNTIRDWREVIAWANGAVSKIGVEIVVGALSGDEFTEISIDSL